MTNAMTTNAGGAGIVPAAVERALIGGDLSRLSEAERLSYYNSLCTSLGLNPLTKPFQYITLNGKLTLYAAKDCTDQLRSLRGVSITDLTGQVVDDLYVVSAKGSDKSGRSDAATGAVVIGGLRGEAKANAIMKAETKAKRRLTLSLCGLGMLDESEVDSIEGAKTHAPAVVAKPLNLAPVAPAPVVEAEPVAEAPASAPADLEAAKDSLEDYAEHIKAAKTLDELAEVWIAIPKAMRPGLVKTKDARKKALTEVHGNADHKPTMKIAFELIQKISMAQTKTEIEKYAAEAKEHGPEIFVMVAKPVADRLRWYEQELVRLSKI